MHRALRELLLPVLFLVVASACATRAYRARVDPADLAPGLLPAERRGQTVDVTEYRCLGVPLWRSQTPVLSRMDAFVHEFKTPIKVANWICLALAVASVVGVVLIKAAEYPVIDRWLGRLAFAFACGWAATLGLAWVLAWWHWIALIALALVTAWAVFRVRQRRSKPQPKPTGATP